MEIILWCLCRSIEWVRYWVRIVGMRSKQIVVCLRSR